MSLNFHREGSGAPLVLLHGIGFHWQAWTPVIGELSGNFDVIACDLPGMGRSDPLPAGIDPTIRAYADGFEAWFQEMDLGRPHVAGNSMGGAIALELADRGAVASAAAFSPAGFWSDAERRYCQLCLGAIAHMPRPLQEPIITLVRTDTGRALLFAQLFGKPRQIPAEEAEAALRDALTAPSFGAALEAFGRYRYEPAARNGSVPVTVAWAKGDRLLPYRLQAPRARRLLPEARHLTLGAGHIPTFDDPAAVAAVIQSATEGDSR